MEMKVVGKTRWRGGEGRGRKRVGWGGVRSLVSEQSYKREPGTRARIWRGTSREKRLIPASARI